MSKKLSTSASRHPQLTRRHLQRHALSAFRVAQLPLFDARALPHPLIDEFAASEPVILATHQYVIALQRAWCARYPQRSLPLMPVSLAVKNTQNQPMNPLSPADRTPVLTTGSTTGKPMPQVTTASASASTSGPAIMPQPAGVVLQIQNAKASQAYRSSVTARDAQGRAVSIVVHEVTIPPDLGLAFDPASGTLQGLPQSDGDHALQVEWSRAGHSHRHRSACSLFINPDPRSLWKVVEPPDGQPFPKAHLHTCRLQGEWGQLLLASRRGRSHEHAGAFRDDDGVIGHEPATGWSWLLVADGAGSASFSREGSRLAVEAAGGHLARSLSGDEGYKLGQWSDEWTAHPEVRQELAKGFHYLFHQAAVLVVQAIEQQAEFCQAKPRDFATTLLVTVARRTGRETFVASFWMGDGAIAAYGPTGQLRLMGAPDAGEYAGQTRFLDRAALQEGFGQRVRVGCYTDLLGVLLMTDGVSDPRFETDQGLADPVRWDALWHALQPILAQSEPEKALADWLNFFEAGHHDDRTIALLC